MARFALVGVGWGWGRAGRVALGGGGWAQVPLGFEKGNFSIKALWVITGRVQDLSYAQLGAVI